MFSIFDFKGSDYFRFSYLFRQKFFPPQKNSFKLICVLFLRSQYVSPGDIDFYIGMLTEKVESGIVGPTIQCIIGIQYTYTDK